MNKRIAKKMLTGYGTYNTLYRYCTAVRKLNHAGRKYKLDQKKWNPTHSHVYCI